MQKGGCHSASHLGAIRGGRAPKGTAKKKEKKKQKLKKKKEKPRPQLRRRCRTGRPAGLGSRSRRRRTQEVRKAPVNRFACKRGAK